MIRLKTKSDWPALRSGGRRLGQILKTLSDRVAPGVLPVELDDYTRELIRHNGDEPAFLNYRPPGSHLVFPAALCVSVNDEIVHGLPGRRPFKPGDLVTLDLGLKHQGLITDAAVTVGVGEISQPARRLVDGTKEALAAAIKVARVGRATGDIGAAAAAVASRYGLGIIRDLAGHGVGYAVHEDPLVPNFGQPGEGAKLRPGLVIAIEPMFTLGAEAIKLLPDGFTLATADESLAAHFEHTVLITAAGPEILTLPD